MREFIVTIETEDNEYEHRVTVMTEDAARRFGMAIYREKYSDESLVAVDVFPTN